MVQLTILYFCLPTLLLAAPAEDALKQQMANGLLRNDESSYWNYLSPGRPLRRLDTLTGDGFGRLQKKFDSLSGVTFGNQKRNFDEIDNTGLDFVGNFRKRNFDEIDNAGFGAFIKRRV